MLINVLGFALASTLVAAPAQESLQLATLIDSARAMFAAPRDFIVRAAEKMPEEHYTFRPTPDVRTFGELIGHIADGYNLLCGLSIGNPMPANMRAHETSKGNKAQLMAALKAEAGACDAAFTQLASGKGVEIISFARAKHPRIAVLHFNTSHAWEHYGNVVTYLRLKGLVPPSSER